MISSNIYNDCYAICWQAWGNVQYIEYGNDADVKHELTISATPIFGSSIILFSVF